LLENVPSLVQYSTTMLENWLRWKQELIEECKQIIG
jgi:hypothetical protein